MPRFLLVVFIFFVTGCTSGMLRINPGEWDSSLRGVEKEHGFNVDDGIISLEERQKRLDSLEIENRQIFVGKRGYKVVFANESSHFAIFEVRKSTFFSVLSLPIRSISLEGHGIHIDTVMPGSYDVTVKSYYGDYKKTYEVTSASSWSDRISGYSHCEFVFRRISRYGFQRQNYAPQ
jgi:hypothetical protein